MTEPNEFAMSSLEKLHEKVKKAIELLDAADCPQCAGDGVIIFYRIGSEAVCCGNVLDSGECCNNPIQNQIQTQDIRQCQWCDEVSKLRG